MPEITIYITNKNYGKFLNKSINSALKQNFQNFEIIIIDDGSTDNSKKIIEKFRKKKNIRIFYRKSKGLLNNINFAIRASRANFILRLDADDYLDSNALKVLHKKIDSVICVTMIHGQKDEVVPTIFSKYTLELFNKAKKKKVIIRNGDHSLSNQKPLKRIERELDAIIKNII